MGCPRAQNDKNGYDGRRCGERAQVRSGEGALTQFTFERALVGQCTESETMAISRSRVRKPGGSRRGWQTCCSHD